MIYLERPGRDVRWGSKLANSRQVVNHKWDNGKYDNKCFNEITDFKGCMKMKLYVEYWENTQLWRHIKIWQRKYQRIQ